MAQLAKGHADKQGSEGSNLVIFFRFFFRRIESGDFFQIFFVDFLTFPASFKYFQYLQLCCGKPNDQMRAQNPPKSRTDLKKKSVNLSLSDPPTLTSSGSAHGAANALKTEPSQV